MNPDVKAVHVAQEFAHDSPLITCRFDPKGLYIFATAEDRAVIRWELADAKRKTVLKAHDSWVGALAFSPDGQTLVSAGYDDTLIWWPATTGNPEPIRKVTAHKGWIRAVSVNADGSLLASGGNDRIVKLWNFADGKLIREMPGHELDIYSMCFHPSGEFLLTGDLMGQVHQWEVATGKRVRTFDAKDLHDYNTGQSVHYGGVRSMAISPDGKNLACVGLHKGTNPLGAVNEPLVVRFDWESGKLIKKQLSTDLKGVLWRCAFLPDGTLVAASGGTSGGYLLFWGAGDEKPLHQFKLPGTAREMDLHPDGIQIACAHAIKKVTISMLAPK